LRETSLLTKPRLPINYISLIIICCTYAQAQVGPLVWQDDFNDQSLDTAYWHIETGTGVNGDWGTGQLDRERAENLSFMDSMGRTTAMKMRS